jgi:L-2,4-diaminobutyric acid acetyltransferase
MRSPRTAAFPSDATSTVAPGTPVLASPTPADGADLWRAARDSGSLDLNSPYAYLLVATDWAATSVVARDDRGLVGFVAGYRPPTDPDHAFVWQVAVADRARGRGIGRQLLHGVLERPANLDARFLTATVTPSNAASLALFRGIARDLEVPCEERERFPAALFPSELGTHEPELQLRIGPLPPR